MNQLLNPLVLGSNPRQLFNSLKDFKNMQKVFTDERTKERDAQCGNMRKKKDDECHPGWTDPRTKHKIPAALPCTSQDNQATLIAKHNAFMKCKNMRHIENNSKCDDEQTVRTQTRTQAQVAAAADNHENQEQTELESAGECRRILTELLKESERVAVEREAAKKQARRAHVQQRAPSRRSPPKSYAAMVSRGIDKSTRRSARKSARKSSDKSARR